MFTVSALLILKESNTLDEHGLLRATAQLLGALLQAKKARTRSFIVPGRLNETAVNV